MKSDALDRAMRLTTRQMAIMALVCQGWTSKRISRLIRLGLGGVKNELSIVYDKLGATGHGDQRTYSAVKIFRAMVDLRAGLKAREPRQLPLPLVRLATWGRKRA